MIQLEPIIGANLERRTASPSRIMIASLFGVAFLALFASVALAADGLARIEAHYAAEARV